jgi:hypothetical protein
MSVVRMVIFAAHRLPCLIVVVYEQPNWSFVVEHVRTNGTRSVTNLQTFCQSLECLSEVQ